MRKDPLKAYRYLVEIDGITQAGFSEATIPDSAQDPIEYREGTDLPTVRKIPGLIKYSNLELKWGSTDSLELYNWRKLVEDGNMEEARKNMAIIVLNERGEATARWEFREAWPSKYDGPDLKASGNEIAVENLTVTHEGVSRVA